MADTTGATYGCLNHTEVSE